MGLRPLYFPACLAMAMPSFCRWSRYSRSSSATAANTVSVRYVKYGAWASRNSSGITLLHATNYPKN